MNQMITVMERQERLKSMGFENEHQYAAYLQLRKALSQKIITGIAS